MVSGKLSEKNQDRFPITHVGNDPGGGGCPIKAVGHDPLALSSPPVVSGDPSEQILRRWFIYERLIENYHKTHCSSDGENS